MSETGFRQHMVEWQVNIRCCVRKAGEGNVLEQVIMEGLPEELI